VKYSYTPLLEVQPGAAWGATGYKQFCFGITFMEILTSIALKIVQRLLWPVSTVLVNLFRTLPVV